MRMVFRIRGTAMPQAPRQSSRKLSERYGNMIRHDRQLITKLRYNGLPHHLPLINCSKRKNWVLIQSWHFYLLKVGHHLQPLLVYLKKSSVVFLVWQCFFVKKAHSLPFSLFTKKACDFDTYRNLFAFGWPEVCFTRMSVPKWSPYIRPCHREVIKTCQCRNIQWKNWELSKLTCL